MRNLLALLLLSGLLILCGISCWSQTPAGLPGPLMKEVASPQDLPPGTYTLVKTWRAQDAGHKTGHVVDDPEAEGGTAWEARTGADNSDQMLFGPYLDTDPGDFVVFFRMKLLEPAEGEMVGTLDACVAFGQRILVSLELPAADLTVGKYVQVPLGFQCDQGKLECRFQWPDAGSVRIDTISLFRLTGGSIAQGHWRVPEAVPSGLPKDLATPDEPRPFPEVFPQSAPPAKQLLVCDLRKERQDQRLMMLSLQGLVNRTQPRIYSLYVSTDEQWLQHLLDRKWVEGTTPAKPEELLSQFRDCYKGIIITDPLLPASKNVATMLASVKDGLVASPRLARQLTLPVLDDLRGRWKTNVEAYRWAFDNLWPSLNHHVIACSWPDHLGLRDYLVANKVFIFWISGALDGARKYADPTAEVRLMEELLAKMPVNIPVMSYPWAGKDIGIGEGPGVTLFAEFGKYLVGSIDCTNLTVHSGVRVPELRQKPAPPPPPLQSDKVYVAVVISDGDNLPVLTAGNFPQLWQDKLRGQFPIGWTMSPSAHVLIPDIADYYFSGATPNDQFLGAVSGVGYTYPDSYGKRFRDRAGVYDGFLDQTAENMRACDEKDLWIMNATRPEIISRYAERIPFLDALFPDYGRRLMTGEEATYATARNVPVFHAITGWAEGISREEQINRLVADVRRMTPAQRPAFLHFFVLNWFADLPLLQATLQRLGPDYVAVRPDHLAALWHQEMAREKVAATFPQMLPAFEGQPVTLRGAVRNVSADPQTVHFGEVAGLADATIQPPSADLAAAAQVEVTLQGKPTAKRVEFAITGDFPTRRAAVTLRLIHPAELLSPLPADLKLTAVAYLEAAQLPHRSGKEVADPDAAGGTTWVARAGDAEAGYVIFGPYAPLKPGKYVALFRLKRLGEGAGVVAKLDTCVGGGTPATSERDVTAEELPVGEYRLVPMVFDHPGGAYETRVVWSGAAPLVIDGISLWEATP